MPKVSIDFTRIEQRLIKHATTGMEDAAEYTLAKARKYAPVRKLFRGTTYREPTKARPFRLPIERRVITRKEGAGKRISGHSNSLIPLFRTRDSSGRKAYLTGDFRAVSQGRKNPILQQTVVTNASGVGGRVATLKKNALGPEEIRVNGKPALTSRGRYEFRSGRAAFRAPGERTKRIGGRLRGELHIEGPFKRGGGLWWYVVSRTKDRGRLYGRDMEFGNSRTRAHPFLRPALMESRGPLRRFVRAAVYNGLRSR